MPPHRLPTPEDLRRLAETKLPSEPSLLEPLTLIETQRLLHELQVQQIELEMQNEELQLARNALEEEARRYTDLYDFSPLGYFSLDKNGNITSLNLAAASLLGAVRKHLQGKQLGAFIASKDLPLFNSFINDVFAGNQFNSIEVSLDIKGFSQIVHIEAKGSPDNIECNAIIQDITARKETEEALKTSHQLLEATQSIGKLGGWEYNLITHSVSWTAETYRLHDISPDLFIPTPETALQFFSPDSFTIISAAITNAVDHQKEFDLELKTITAKGRHIDVRTTCMVSVENEGINKGKTIKLTGIFQDITERKAAEESIIAANRKLANSNALLARFAHFDPLTLLPNRVLLAERLENAMKHCQRHRQALAVAYLDLDGFKAINDNHGHNVGDEILVTLAQRMKNALRTGDTLARIGGDEFIAVLSELESPDEYEPVLDRLLESASEPLIIGDSLAQLSASIGVTIYPQDNVNAEQLIRHADQAMYIAKQAGKNRYHMFDVVQDAAAHTRHSSLEDIRRAFLKNEFVMYYQPQVNMKTGKVIGAEALIRWRHPQHGLLLPAEFLPTIENHPLSVDIGMWVTKTAIAQMNEWKAAGINIPVSINVSAHHLQQDDFVDCLTKTLAEYPAIKATEIGLEILETTALKDMTNTSKLMDACIALGIHFSLDDFGTGYSSLTYLKRLPADFLKIDQSFVNNMISDENDLAIIKGIIGLATSFSRQVIAEGVETEAHGNMLQSIGCDMAQGFGIAHPMEADDLPLWITNWQRVGKWAA